MTFSSIKRLPGDTRDFSHHLLFGTAEPEMLPSFDFDVGPNPPAIIDQIDLNDCASCSTSELNTTEQHNEGDPFSFLYQMAKINQVMNDASGDGADLRSAAKSLISYGSLKNSESPYTYAQGLPTDRTALFLNDWSNWPPELDLTASERRLGSFYVPDGPNDPFDNFRSALWQNASTWAGSGILFGLNWRPSWTLAPGGVIPSDGLPSAGDPHAVFVRGQKMIEGMPHLVFQNSWSNRCGDGGLYYFPRSIVDTEFLQSGFGAYVFKKIPAAQAKQLLDKIK